MGFGGRYKKRCPICRRNFVARSPTTIPCDPCHAEYTRRGRRERERKDREAREVAAAQVGDRKRVLEMTALELASNESSWLIFSRLVWG